MNTSKMKNYRVVLEVAAGGDMGSKPTKWMDIKAHSAGYDDFGGLVFLVNKPGIMTPQNPQGVEVALQTYTFREFIYFVDMDNLNNVN